jgi:small subunit ribosomal protein S16
LSVKIRLKRMGSKKKPFYRFVAADSRNARDGRFIETLGYYNPMTNPPDLKIDEAAVIKWMQRGAQPSPNTESLFRKLGFMQKWQLLKQGVKPEEIDARLGAAKNADAPPKSTAPEASPEQHTNAAEQAPAKAGDAAKGDDAH